MEKIYGIIAAGGYGREVMPLAGTMLAAELLTGEIRLVFVVEGDPQIEELNGVEVLSLSRFLEKSGDRFFNIAIADSKVRDRISRICVNAGASAFDIAALNVVLMDQCEIGEGAILSPFVTITSNVKIGKFFHANIYSYVAHDCVIGDYVTFAPSVGCNGNVVIGDHAYIGTGAIIKPGKQGAPRLIGEGAIIGMGAVVTKDVAPYSVVVGNPARPVCK